MYLDETELELVELPRLRQYFGWNRYLTDVVKRPSDADAIHAVRVQPHLFRNRAGDRRHPLLVPGGVRVPYHRHRGQRGDRLCLLILYPVVGGAQALSLIHISEPTRLGMISYAV